MSDIEIWYHDPIEADRDRSWIANSSFLQECEQGSFDVCPYSRVLALAEYAQPDIVLSHKGIPFLSAELTRMNPSGHNLPQRFSCLVRAAEQGISSIFYYPKYSRRSNSDPNPRYLNVRVPLAQARLSQIYDVPSLSVFWPTNTTTLLPESGLQAHTELASLIENICRRICRGRRPGLNSALSRPYFDSMQTVAREYATERRYPPNPSYRRHFMQGDNFTRQVIGRGIDPPTSCQVFSTSELLSELFSRFNRQVPRNRKTNILLSRELSFVYTGTPNSREDGPEHPYPGYLTLLDILYLRTERGQSPRDRNMNLVFRLPIDLERFARRVLDRPTGLNILMEFADLIVINDAVVTGGFIRNLSAGALLIHEGT